LFVFTDGEAEMPFDVDKKVLNVLINTINTKIAPFDQKIQHVKSFDLNDEEYLVFTYKSEISMNKFQTVYSEQEVHFFRLLMKEIARSEELQIKTMICINLTSKIPKLKTNMKMMSKARAEELLSEWMLSGYFLEQDNDIFFGPRMLSEFGVYLKTNFPENIVACHLCKNVIFAVS
jgi:non-structural maintenance of chromosomes element 1